ncbi:MAG: hypothetical protein AAF108_06685 [Planctomycetota bacterium]
MSRPSKCVNSAAAMSAGRSEGSASAAYYAIVSAHARRTGECAKLPTHLCPKGDRRRTSQDLTLLEDAWSDLNDPRESQVDLALLARAAELGKLIQDAERLWTTLLQGEEGAAQTRLGLARCAIARERWTDAIEHISAARRLTPRGTESDDLELQVLQGTHDYNSAALLALRLLAAHPESASRRRNTAAMLRRAGRDEEASRVELGDQSMLPRS